MYLKDVQKMSKHETVKTALSIFNEFKPEERERALGILQGIMIAKGKPFKEVLKDTEKEKNIAG